MTDVVQLFSNFVFIEACLSISNFRPRPFRSIHHEKKSLTAIEAGSAFMDINYAAGTFPHRENFGLVVHRHRFLSQWEKASIKNELLRKKIPNCLPV